MGGSLYLRLALPPVALAAGAVLFALAGVEAYAGRAAPWKVTLGELWLWSAAAAALAWALAAPAVEARLLAAARGLPPPEGGRAPGETALAVTAAAFMAGLTVAVVRRPAVLPPLAREDGPLESLTACLYLAAAFLLAAALWGRRERPRRRRWLAALAGACFLVFLEEVSWGQRLLGFATPAPLARLNTQGEFTLHNVGASSLILAPALLGVSLFLGLLPFLVAWYPGVRALTLRLDLPVPRGRTAALFFLALAAWAAIGVRVGTPGPFPAPRGGEAHLDDECFETFVALLFFLEAVAETARWPARRRGQPSP